MAVINIGQIAAIFVGTSSPTNTNLLWRDTSTNPAVFRSYNDSTAQWEEIGGSSGGGSVIYPDIPSRPASAQNGSIAFVQDASGDVSVGRDIWAMYIWENSDWRLVAYEEDVSYEPSLDDAVSSPNGLGSISPGTTVGDLRGKSHTDLFTRALFPEANPTISQNRSANLSGISTQTIEIGTSFDPPVLTATLNQGQIQNGDGTNGPSLVGSANNYEFRDPDNATIQDGAGNVVDPPAYLIQNGGNTWDVIVTYDAGTGQYFTSYQNPSNILDGSRVAGSISDNSNTITGRYFRFYGSSSSSVTNSAEVRSLPTSSFDTNNSFTLNTGNTLTKFIVALPSGRSITQVIDTDALGADITSQYVFQGIISVNTGGGSGAPLNYNVYEMNIASPYSTSHAHVITIS